MKTRALGTAIVASDRIEAGTFHGFGVRFLRSHGEQLGIAPDFEIIDPEEEKELARAVAATARVANRLGAWQHARKRGLAPDDRTGAFGAVYEAAKREQGLIDFDDLVVATGTILAENVAIAAAYGSRFQHILVDEFQDNTPLSSGSSARSRRMWRASACSPTTTRPSSALWAPSSRT